MKIIHILVCALLGTALAAAQAPKEKKSPPGKAEKPAKVEKKGPAEQVLSGPVVSIDTAKNTISIKKKDKELLVTVDTSTVVMAGEKKIAFKDLKAGDVVTVKYFQAWNGTMRAKDIRKKIGASKKAEKKKESEKKPEKAAKEEKPEEKAKPQVKKPEKAEAKADTAKAPGKAKEKPAKK
jgi:hypothetical protein